MLFGREIAQYGDSNVSIQSHGNVIVFECLAVFQIISLDPFSVDANHGHPVKTVEAAVVTCAIATA